MNIIRPLQQFFPRVKKFVQEESMHGLSNGIKLGVAAEDEHADDPLLHACQDFQRLNRIWLEGNPEGESSSCLSLDAVEHKRVLQLRRSALRDVIENAPTCARGLLAKYHVFTQLMAVEEQTDISQMQFFCQVLVEDYHEFFLRKQIYLLENEPKKSWKSTVQNFFSNMGG